MPTDFTSGGPTFGYRTAPDATGRWQGLNGLWYDASGNQIADPNNPQAAPIPVGTSTSTTLFPSPTAPAAPAPTQGGGLVDPFTQPAPDYLTAPSFTPPTFQQAPAFKAPTIQDALNDPGYTFGLQQGEGALQNSAAAGGVLNTGNTLKNILEFGNNYATTKYNDLFNRNLSAYQTNYNTQFVDPYKAAYQSALDTFQPKLADWSAHNNFNWNKYLNDYSMFRNRQLDTVNANTALS